MVVNVGVFFQYTKNILSEWQNIFLQLSLANNLPSSLSQSKSMCKCIWLHLNDVIWAVWRLAASKYIQVLRAIYKTFDKKMKKGQCYIGRSRKQMVYKSIFERQKWTNQVIANYVKKSLEVGYPFIFILTAITLYGEFICWLHHKAALLCGNEYRGVS